MHIARSHTAPPGGHRRLIAAALLACTITTTAAAGPRIVGPQDADAKEVRDTAAKFYHDLADGNADAAHALFDGPQDHAALLDAELDAVAASRRVARSILSHFGPDNSNLLTSSAVAMFRRVGDRQSNAMVVLNGDDAATAGAAEPDNGLLLRKIAGHWKVVRTTYGIRSPVVARAHFALLTDAYDDVRKKVDGGEVKSADAALAMLEKTIDALDEQRPLKAAGALPAPPPTTQPAPTAERLRSLIGRQLFSAEVEDAIASLPCTPRLSEYPAALFVNVPELGFDLSLELPAGRVTAVHLYGDGNDAFSRYPGALPAGLAFDRPRIDIERRLGRPPGYLGSVQSGVSAEYPNLKLLLQYGPGPLRNPRAPLRLVTLIETASFPGATTRPFNEPPPQLAIRPVLDENDRAPADRLSDPLDPTGIATLRVSRQPIVDQDSITSVHAVPDEHDANAWKIAMDLTPQGGRQLAQATRNLIGRRVAIVLGSRVLMAPVVRGPIADHVIIDFGSKAQKEFPHELLRQISLAMTSLPATEPTGSK